MYGIFIIFLMYAIGNLISWLIGGFIPGSVIGMVLLFVALTLKWVNPTKVRPTADFLVKNMALFFVPVGAGIMVSSEYLNGNYIAVIASVLISTVLVLLTTGYIQQYMEKWKK